MIMLKFYLIIILFKVLEQYQLSPVIGDGNGGPNPNAIQISIRNGVGIVAKSGGGTLLSYTTPTANLRQQWTLTFNGSTIKMYINGVLDASTTTASNNSGLSNSLYIGTYQNASGENFVGNVSNCIIYNRVLSDAEVLQNYINTKSRFGL
jgi:hypothetical protein